MSEPTRYDLHLTFPPEPRVNGAWVTYQDHTAALEVERAKVEKLTEALRDVCEVGDLAAVDTARQALSEIEGKA